MWGGNWGLGEGVRGVGAGRVGRGLEPSKEAGEEEEKERGGGRGDRGGRVFKGSSREAQATLSLEKRSCLHVKASLGSLIKTGIVLGLNVLMSPSPGPLAIAGGGGGVIGPFSLPYCLSRYS